MYVWNFTKPRRLSRHFPPRLELLTFPEGWQAELLIFPGCMLRILAEIFTQPRRLSKYFPPRLELLTFPETGGPPA